MRFKHKVILASGSPRRRELIGYLFKNIEILKYSCDEPLWSPGQSPKAYLELCLEAKWQAAQKVVQASDDAVLLVADTIVIHGRQVLGKPRSPAEARATLRSLSGQRHLVWTGFRLGHAGGSGPVQERIVESRVSFRKLSEKEIADYVRSGEPMDKAGSYGFQGIGIQNILAIEGPYTNIVGLPLEVLRESAGLLGLR
jgi:septum formation protein